MTQEFAGIVLAAGEGTRLRPMTTFRPKALCPVANHPLIDHAIARARDLTPHVAVNVHHLRDQLEGHLDGQGVHISVEEPKALGTAGALGQLRDWIDGRDVLVMNADTWHERGLAPFAAGWDRDRPRLLVLPEVLRPDFEGRWRYVGAALLPWRLVRELSAVPSGLYEAMWRDLDARGHLEFVRAEGLCVPCDTPMDYLCANLLANGGESSIGEGARVDGEVERSVVWPGSVVRAGERLVEAIRIGTDVTIRPFA